VLKKAKSNGAALIAVGRSILLILYYLLKEGGQYADLGATSLTVLSPNA
jgi:hypothetical protein